jgi:signal transduction histidine kinase
MVKRRFSPSIQLALFFILFGTTWIILTDSISILIANNDLAILSHFQTYKGVLFVFLSAGFIYLVSRRILERHQALELQLNGEILRHKDQLAQEVFDAQEMERRKLGEELHDNINQLLGVVKLYIEHAQVNPSAKDEMLKKSAEYLMQVINEIRALSKSLISPTLTESGLLQSVNELIASIWEIKKIRIGFQDQNFHEDLLTDAKKTMVFRIMQEQLNNVLKHSQAENVDIELKHFGSEVKLIIRDNGIGFDMNNVNPGLGLKNIQHRLELINGRMKVQSAPGQGCTLEATFEV